MINKYKYSFLYCIFASVASMTINGAIKLSPSFLILFIASVVIVLYFLITTLKSLSCLYIQLLINKNIFILLNLNTAVIWAITFYDISIGGNNLYRLGYFCCLTLLTSIFASVYKKIELNAN